MGTAELRVQSVDGIGLKREDRICGQCSLREVEDVEHLVLKCGGLVREREVLMKRIAEVTVGVDERGDEGCRHLKAGKAIECMWRRDYALWNSHRQVYWYSATPSPSIIH